MKKILLSIIAGLVLSSTEASAQLLMEKSRVRLTVTPGETIVDSMNLHNTGGQPAEVKVYWQDFVYEPPFEGKKKFSQPGTSQYSMEDWITYSPQLMTLPAQGKREISYTIRVPEDAKGGYYGVLFFEQGLGQGTTSTGVNIITRLGSLFFVESENRDKTSKIDSIRLNGKFLEGKYTNQGDVFLFPKGVYYLVDGDGVVTDRGELDKMYLPPEAIGDFKVYLSESIDPGDYTMVVTFDLEDGDSIIKEIDFTKDRSGQLKITQLRD